MRNTIKDFVVSIMPPVQRLQRNRDDLRLQVAQLEAENRNLKTALASKANHVSPHHMPFDFDADGMKLWDKNLKSLRNPKFTKAYADSVKGAANIEFRAYVCCWAASQAAKLPGDFVECGVNDGWFSLTICNFLEFNSLGKSFYLFDTYNGIPAEQISDRESERAALHQYVDCYELTKAKFAAFPNAKLVRGRVPETLPTAAIEKVAYLSIDMNIAKPERDAIEFFWPRLSTGGIIVLDDYAFGGYDVQHEAMDDFASGVNTSILTLPAGQGLIIKSN